MDINACSIEEIYFSELAQCYIWRWDRLHPTISGNKFFKLIGHEQKMSHKGTRTWITFGGAYSNHLHAVVHFSSIYNYKPVCIIRSDEIVENDTIADLKKLQADIHFVSREDYRKKESAESIQKIINSYPEAYIIPEGGEGEAGESGFEIIHEKIPKDITHICVSVGTGTTLKGLRKIIPLSVRLLGFTSFKNMSSQFSNKWLEENNVELIDCSDISRFGKATSELIDFMNAFYRKHSIPLDFVYTTKMFMKAERLLSENFFSKSDRILFIHTGGLQGNRSIQEKLIY